LQKAVGTDRIAATWYSGTSFTIDVNLIDGNTHQVALYCLDWDSNTRAQTVEVLDGASGAVLDSRSISAFSQGQYLVWNLTGHVKMRVTRTGGVNAVVSGLYFDQSNATLPTPTPSPTPTPTPTPNTAPTVSLTSPTEGAAFTAPANISISANASDNDGTISKVDFYSGSTLIGTDTAAPYSMTWGNVAAGTYMLTAVATDNAGATKTSSAVNVTVNSSPADFSITASPTSRNIRRGTDTTFTFTVIPSGGFSGNVTFSVNGALPAGVTASFSPQSVNTSGSSTMTVRTSSATPTDSYVLTINGTGGHLQRTKSVTLNVRK
jgi:hypothetical protein